MDVSSLSPRPSASPDENLFPDESAGEQQREGEQGSPLSSSFFDSRGGGHRGLPSPMPIFSSQGDVTPPFAFDAAGAHNTAAVDPSSRTVFAGDHVAGMPPVEFAWRTLFESEDEDPNLLSGGAKNFGQSTLARSGGAVGAGAGGGSSGADAHEVFCPRASLFNRQAEGSPVSTVEPQRGGGGGPNRRISDLAETRGRGSSRGQTLGGVPPRGSRVPRGKPKNAYHPLLLLQVGSFRIRSAVWYVCRKISW